MSAGRNRVHEDAAFVTEQIGKISSFLVHNEAAAAIDIRHELVGYYRCFPCRAALMRSSLHKGRFVRLKCERSNRSESVVTAFTDSVAGCKCPFRKQRTNSRAMAEIQVRPLVCGILLTEHLNAEVHHV